LLGERVDTPEDVRRLHQKVRRQGLDIEQIDHAYSAADIALWDPNKELEYGLAWAHHRTDYNLYEGWKLRGYPVKVFLRGKLIVDGQNWFGKAGAGRFVHRQAGEIL